jgi:glutathione S-transferase
MQVLTRHLGHFESLLASSSSGWLADTDEPSIADFLLVPRLKWLAGGDNSGISVDILEPYPKVRALIEKLENLPEIKAYYAAK